MVEEKVDEELVAADFEPVLAADEGEARAELQEEPGHIANQALFDVAFMRLGAEAEEIEVVWVLQDRLGEFRFRGGQLAVEVLRRGAGAQMEP